MSSFISKKYVEQQDIQQGQVPDSQSEPNQAHQQSYPNKQQVSNPETKKQIQQDQFIFQTFTDAQLQHQNKHRDKQNQKNWQFNRKMDNLNKKDYQKTYDKNDKQTYDRSSYNKVTDKYHDRNQRSERSSYDKSPENYYQKDKHYQKNVNKEKDKKQKEKNNTENKKKQKIEEPKQTQQLPQNLGLNRMNPMSYYPPMPVSGHSNLHMHPNFMPPGSIPPAYYPGYATPQMMPISKHLSPMFAHPSPVYYPPNPNMYPSIPPPSLYSSPVAGSYQIPYMYPPHGYNMPNPYSNPKINYAAINQQNYRVESNIQNLHMKQAAAVKYYQKQIPKYYQNQNENYQRSSVQNNQKNQNISINRATININEKREPIILSKHSQQRDRSRQHKQRDQRRQKYQNADRLKQKALRQLKKQLQQQKQNTKQQINKRISLIFTRQQHKQQFLYILRDILKYMSIQDSKNDWKLLANLSKNSLINTHNKQSSNIITVQNKEILISNFQKSVMKLQKLFSQFQNLRQVKQKQQKKQYLLEILNLLNMENILIKIKQNKLRKRIIGEKRASQIKKLLDQLVKDPRIKVK